MIPAATQGRARCRRLPKSLFGRIFFGPGFLTLILFSAVGFVVFSVWIENRFPSDDPKQALLPAVQKATTKPVVDVLSHGIRAYGRSLAEAPFMYAQLSLDEVIARFLDDRVDLVERRLYAYDWRVMARRNASMHC